MAYTIEKLLPLRLMKAKLSYPLASKTDRLHGSVIYLLTKNIDDSIEFLNNNNFLINNHAFSSYYTEKNYSLYISSLNESSNLIDTSNNYYFYMNGTKNYYPNKVEELLEDFDITQNYAAINKRLLYNQRMKNQKDLMIIYKKIKKEVPFIRNTFINLKLYKSKNLIQDWSYYANLFFTNNDLYMRDKGLDLLHHLMTMYLDDPRLEKYGYTRKTCIIPVESWMNEDTDIFDFRNDLNPFSMIFRFIKKGYNLSDYWKGIDFIIASKTAYFKVDFSNFGMKELVRFVYLTKKLTVNDISDAEPDSEEETPEENIEPDQFTRNIADTSKSTKRKSKVKETIISAKTLADEPAPEEEKVDTTSSDEEWIKSVLKDLADNPTPQMNEARKKRLAELDTNFNNMTINNKKVGTILENYLDDDKDITPETIPIDNINEEWKEIKTLNFNKEYDITDDIVAILKSLRYKSKPLAVVKMEAEDTTTREDYIYTLKVTLEDSVGTRSNIVVDIPKFINNRFMKLRGNLKTIQGEILLLPIIKTEPNTAQIVTSYHKIFIYRISPSNGSKTTKAVSKLTKALDHLKDSQQKTGVHALSGSNSLIYEKYDLPIEYTDLGSLYSRIVCDDGSFINFDYDKTLELMGKDFNPDTDIPIGYDAKTKKGIFGKRETIAKDIAEFLVSKDKTFAEFYDTSTPSNKLSYSEASIMSTRIPVIVLMAFSEGLQKSMDKSKISYRVSETRPRLEDSESLVKFKDGYLIYNDEKPKDSLLMSGLAKCPGLANHSIKEMNDKNLWLEMLENFGGRFIADGLDNFYDCEFDPMTIVVCKKYKMPYDYIEALAYANELLASNAYNRHSDITGNRIRINEILAGYFYQAIANAYGDYANRFKRAKGAKYTIKQSAVIDAIMKDPGFTDLSISSPIQEAKSANTVSFKGLSGMNADRAYTLDKRIYDKSMLGVLSLTTGFAGNVGISRELTINSSIMDKRGAIKSDGTEGMNTLNSLSIYEALTPYGTTHDDPTRSAMGYVQTAQHQMRVKSSSPNLITYGMDEALPYFTSNIFSYKFKGVKGKVLKVDEHSIFFTQVDKNGNKSNHYINLDSRVEKNSDGGFYVTVKFKPTVKTGDTLKYNDILAYDPSSYSKALATDNKSKNISYNIGTLAKLAIMCTDQSYEDASIIDERLADAMTSFYCVEKNCSLDAESNVFSIVEKGQDIEEGTPLLIFQNAFNEKEANILLKNISDDELDLASDFGRIQVRSKITGTVEDIKIYRTCELSELSPSMRKIVSKYEKNINDKRKELEKLGVSEIEINETLEPTGKQEPMGKLKNTENGVLFCFYIKCADKMGVGDKLIYNTALKGVVHDIIPKGKEPYTDFRPNEPIDTMLTTTSVNARMVPSIIISGSLNKVIIELTRKCKDILGIPWDNLTNTDNLK